MALRRVLLWTVGLVVLATVFAAYLQPDLMRDLSDFLWSCF